MSGINFKRVDLRLIIRRDEDVDSLVKIEFFDELVNKKASAGKSKIRFYLPERADENLLIDLAREELPAQIQEHVSSLLKQSNPADARVIRRLALDIADPQLAMLNWENLFNQSVDFTVVRVSPVKPRVSLIPFTLPLRILQISPHLSLDIKSRIREVFGEHLSEEELTQIAQVDSLDFEDFNSWTLPTGKATAEILHFGNLPTLETPEIFLSTAFPEKVGTLGWFMRAADFWQTRLIIINCPEWESASARKLAAGIVGRGGPAVVICGARHSYDSSAFYRYFYDKLIHDFPLDSILFDWRTEPVAPHPPDISLFVGSGREDLLRFSTLGERLINVGKVIRHHPYKRELITLNDINNLVLRNMKARRREEQTEPKVSTEFAEEIVRESLGIVGTADASEINLYENLLNSGVDNTQLPGLRHKIIHSLKEKSSDINQELLSSFDEESKVSELVDIVYRHAQPRMIEEDETREILGIERPVNDILGTLDNLSYNWGNIIFEHHEREGVIPLSREVTRLRKNAGVRDNVSYEEVAPKTTKPRFVKSSLWRIADDGAAKRLNQRKTRLHVGRTYHLGIQIGPRDARIFTLGEAALIEEVFKWTPEMTGTWVEIGVTGIDFDVIGDPVQELWLPRETSSELIYFAIIPRTNNTARLRFCLYHKQNLIQSFMLAAITGVFGSRHLSAEKKSTLLAQALGSSPERVGKFSYLSRLEYSLTTSMDGIEKKPARALSILVNDSNGEPRITVKGADEFSTRQLSSALPEYVKKVRSTLDEISYKKIGDGSNKVNIYLFPGTAKPEELREELKKALKKLAIVGWQLFDEVFPGKKAEREKLNSNLETNLETEPRVIQVAHILREKVIPWAVMYDKQYRHDRTEDENSQPVAHDVCLAALPRADGTLPAQKCGELKECLLHKEQAEKRKNRGEPVFCDNTVVCPLHFWGFKHIIEIPPQQVAEDKSKPQKECILFENKIQLLAGMNSSLQLESQHWSELEQIVSSIPNAEWKPKITLREPLIKALEDENLSFIYLYCHASGGADVNITPPYLQFHNDAKKADESITPSDISSVDWKFSPLVFLNGCGTLGYSPDAISFFITKLVDDCNAAGIIGTEITVREILAKEFATLFLKELLSGKSAGESLLHARRSLLARNNPLGLIYTLYAAAQLKFDINKTKCQDQKKP